MTGEDDKERMLRIASWSCEPRRGWISCVGVQHPIHRGLTAEEVHKSIISFDRIGNIPYHPLSSGVMHETNDELQSARIRRN